MVNVETPPENYNVFLDAANETFLAKDTDYDSRFMRGMIELDAFTIWAWEVDKKLDRIRTWINRGELLVKGEGVINSVQDLFIYSVQYEIYSIGYFYIFSINDWQRDRSVTFYPQASKWTPAEWIEFLIQKKRIAPNEYALQNIIKLYMGDKVNITDWQQAIREILRG